MTVTLDNIIRSYLLGQGKSSLHGYIKLMKFAIDALQKISLNYSVLNKTVKCRLDQKKAVPFPSDCLSVVTVMFKVGDRFEAFDVDSSIATQHSYVNDAVSATANGIFSEQQRTLCNYLDEDGCYCNLTCYGNGYNGAGYFTVNHKAREIQFSSEVDSTQDIYVFYRSNGFDPKSKSVISIIFKPMIEAYIHWQLSRSRFGDSAAETEARRFNFQREQDELLQQLMPITGTGIIAAQSRASQFNRFQ